MIGFKSLTLNNPDSARPVNITITNIKNCLLYTSWKVFSPARTALLGLIRFSRRWMPTGAPIPCSIRIAPLWRLPSATGTSQRMSGPAAVSYTHLDNLLSPEEQGDLEYRKTQLQRLQTEVVDLEDMGTGVSITDLGLNEFRMELMEYAKTHPELETCPGGISAVAAATPDAPAGVVFILKNVHNEVNIDNRNRLHPYYLVYLTEDGVTVHDHLSPKDTLDAMRQLCRGKDKPIEELYRCLLYTSRCV